MPLFIIDVFKKFGSYALAGCVIVAALLYAHHEIYQNGFQDGQEQIQAAWNAEKVKQAAAVAEATIAAKTTSETNSQHAIAAAVRQSQDQERVRATFKPIETKVTRYVQSHPSAATAGAGLDAVGLSIWNAANAGTDANPGGASGEHSQQPVGDMPPTSASQ
ncbi:hypothetical protein [Burkholderia alba]|uniref:hypothetical protein n=1 Tax=Burkholderia alba TaxID=2683677 RepID=UPI002B056E65|nr:hypothetical protein [Burkholderia alba]